MLHEAPTDLLDKEARRLRCSAVHALAEQDLALVGPEQGPAVHGVPKVLLVPLDEIKPGQAHPLPKLELQEPPQEEGHVEVKRAVVLVYAVGQFCARRGDLAFLHYRGQPGDLQDDPAQLYEERACGRPHCRVCYPVFERVLVHGVWYRQTLVQVVGYVRGLRVVLILSRPGRHVRRVITYSPVSVAILQ